MACDIGFVGLGAMGKPMVKHLLEAGHSLAVYDVRPEPVSELVGLGARAASSPADTAQNAQIVFVMVVDDGQVKEAVLGPKGVLQGARSGSAIVVCSSLQPETVIEVAARAQAKGVTLLDAPVTRSESAAVEGTLLFLVGGDSPTLNAWLPVFKAMGTDIYHVGDVGAGQVAKMVNNLLLWAGLMATWEGLNLAKRYGVSHSALKTALEKSSGNHWALQRWELMQDPPWAEKDMVNLMAIADAHHLSLPLAGLVKELVKEFRAGRASAQAQSHRESS